MATREIQLNVDGSTHVITTDPEMPLLYALRDDLGLRNPRFGCGLAQCGACTVHIDGQAVRSCVTPVDSVGFGKIVTLAGLGGTDGKAHKIQEAFIEEQVPHTMRLLPQRLADDGGSVPRDKSQPQRC